MSAGLAFAPNHHRQPSPVLRRALTLALVILLHLLLGVALLITREQQRLGIEDRAPFVVTLLPDSRPSKPRAPPPRPAGQPAPPAPRTPAAPVPPKASPDDATPSPATRPQPRPAPPAQSAAPPENTPGNPVEAGEEIFNIDTGQGAGGPGFLPPRWIHKVTDDEFFPLVDEQLLRTRLEVELQMLCTVALDARMTCEVLREWPVFAGLRRAVRQAVPLLRMAPPKRNGHPVANQRVSFLWRVTIDRLAQLPN